jgi:hypothetical protein
MLMIVALTVLLVAWAWIDGGREPLREISEDVAVPGAAK